MQFIKDKDLYKVARITGPTHNLLAIRLSEKECLPRVTPLPLKAGEAERLEGKEIVEQVLAGIEEANQELGKKYFISEIQFVPSDSRPTSVYSFLTKELLKRVDAEGDFAVVS